MESTTENQLKRNRRTALMVGAFAGIALIMTVYAFVQKGVADDSMKISGEFMRMTNSMKTELQHCKERAELNRKIADREAHRADRLMKPLEKKK